MEMFLQEMAKAVFGWWWFCKDGQTKATDAGDRYLVPILVGVAICCFVMLLMVWKFW